MTAPISIDNRLFQLLLSLPIQLWILNRYYQCIFLSWWYDVRIKYWNLISRNYHNFENVFIVCWFNICNLLLLHNVFVYQRVHSTNYKKSRWSLGLDYTSDTYLYCYKSIRICFLALHCNLPTPLPLKIPASNKIYIMHSTQ